MSWIPRDNFSRVLIVAIAAAVFFMFQSQLIEAYEAREDVFKFVGGMLLGALILHLYYSKDVGVKKFLDISEAANRFFTKTTRGRQICSQFGVERHRDGTWAKLSFTDCRTIIRHDGIGAVAGPLFQGFTTHYIMVFDLFKKDISDLNSNLYLFDEAHFDLRDMEKELNRIVRPLMSPDERMAIRIREKMEKIATEDTSELVE